MKLMPKTVLIIGDLPAGVDEELRRTDVECVPDIAAALMRLSDEQQRPCELVLLCEDRPGTWTDRHLASLRHVAPLARYVRLSGSLCEGQARSGRPASGTGCVPWHRWPLAFAGQLSPHGRDRSWSLPVTATPDEIALARFRPALQKASGRIAIYSHTADAAEALAGVCRAAGYDTSISTEHVPPHETETLAVIWDTFPGQLANRDRVSAIRTRHGGAPLVALVGFPRPTDIQAAEAAGIAGVLAKPLDTGDLLWHLEQLGMPASQV